ncbi:polymorphic toxin-type HINT domain-containing protein, partial [Streptomyces sp. NPDC050422]|uniref:polymorphic toxin-type HINT domain-containing protein n=1 Tax=Streptomyces sp. NPDC050422 TaxID=3365614 RepID=UPI0037B1BE24
FYESTKDAWTQAADLKAGQKLQNESGRPTVVIDTTAYTASRTTYDLSIDGLHTYYVAAGEASVLVHNTDGMREVSGSSCPVPVGQARALLDDAQALHDVVSARKAMTDPVGARRADQGTTVATGAFNGRKVYSVNNNKTTKAMRDLADDMGYERISGIEHTDPGIRTDAEQILFNAVDDGTLANRGVVASSRPACGPSRQNCAARAGDYPHITLWERSRTAPWDRG